MNSDQIKRSETKAKFVFYSPVIIIMKTVYGMNVFGTYVYVAAGVVVVVLGLVEAQCHTVPFWLIIHRIINFCHHVGPW